ncbi:MAG TPA: type VI secretion system tube protein Hcp [Verrucomicrobiales bacterium]|nr:type VI secretion system tube protein Hcp [Verrucomicrobiales bacterium]
MKTIRIPSFPFLMLLGALLTGANAWSAQNAYLSLKANGADVAGESSVASVGGVIVQDHIECIAFNHEVFADGSRRIHGPIKIVKRVDKSSPLLYKAFGNNEVIEGTFRFFRHNPDTSQLEHYFTIEIAQGHVSAIRHWFPNTADPASADYPQMEEISFTYATIYFAHEIAFTETSLNWTNP